jgi:hypothetical protein
MDMVSAVGARPAKAFGLRAGLLVLMINISLG